MLPAFLLVIWSYLFVSYVQTNVVYITVYFVPVSRASLRTALSGDLYVPRTCRRFGDRVFDVVAPHVWNSLPTDIKLYQSTTTSFKRRLKTVLFDRGFAEYM